MGSSVSEFFECNVKQTVNHTVDVCPFINFDVRLLRLHEVEDSAVDWLKIWQKAPMKCCNCPTVKLLVILVRFSLSLLQILDFCVFSFLVVSTTTSNCLEKLISKMT